ncbi:MAG: branched-chain amino acid ABC transporter permease [Hyphomicrobiales bacterium]|nr:MAG: branched-chain amino acid ABC transporter permease [Hyphomicrobiales bacterium]
MTAYLVTILILASISAIVALGLNIQWGVAGLVNFGVVGFYSVGAYATAIVALGGGGAWGGLLAGVLASAVLSALIALLTVRLTDDYLAIVALGLAEVVRLVLLNEAWLTGGPLGISGIPRPFAGLVTEANYPVLLLGMILLALAATLLFAEALVRSPFGRALRAVRDDDTVAAALGKDALSLRIKAFAAGGAIIGLAGALHAFYITYIDPSQFTSIVTAYAFMAVIAGGRGSNIGLIIGAGSIMALLEATRFLKDFIPFLDGTKLAALRLAMIGAGIVLLLIFRPQGAMAEPRLSARASRPEAELKPDRLSERKVLPHAS